MKIAEGLDIIKQGWIRKPKGFRVRFDKRTDNVIEAAYSPPLDDAPLNSDVTAWRYAWKLWQATRAGSETDSLVPLYNIVVVDDRNQPVHFFVTGEQMVYNPKRFEGGTEDPVDSADESTGDCLDATDS